MHFPDIPEIQTTTLMTTDFRGLNRGLSIDDGEMADMLNMSSDMYPVLAARQRRGMPVFGAAEGGGRYEYTLPQGMIGTDRLVVIDDGVMYVDGAAVEGLTFSTDADMQPKRMVAMGAYVCIWPDKKYINLANPDDKGDMGNSWSGTDEMVITAMMCRRDGRSYDESEITVSATAPAEPEDKQLWCDTSGENAVLKQYSAIYDEWVQVATTYVKIQAPGIGKRLRENDGIFITGARSVVTEPAAISEDGSVPVVASEETLEFTSEGFSLYSSFTTTGSAGNYTDSTPSIVKRTKVMTVEGIPEGATVTKAEVSFLAASPLYGVRIFTVNGVKCKAAVVNTVPVEVSGNGDVSLQFVFQSGTGGTSPGEHGGGMSINDLVLRVTYTVNGDNAEDDDTKVVETDFLNQSHLLYGAGDDYIIVAGLLTQPVTLAASLKVELRIPDLDGVVEANNRIWGCTYSRKDGTLVNEIHACALGDFRNWYLYQGTSMDSYTVSVGSDGPFTGAAAVKGVPLFFKETCMHRVSGTQPSNFTLNTTACRGVQEGCWRSLAVVGETLYYKSRTDVMAYDGSLPYSVSEKLGTERYFEAAAGAYRDKYYISMHDSSNAWHMYVFDTKRGLWHREDNSRVQLMANVRGALYYIRDNSTPARLISVGVPTDAKEGAFDWSVTFGVFGYAYEMQKYLSRFNIRAQLPEKATMKLEIMYDSNGEWVDMGTVRSRMLRTFMLPVMPRRCDHCQIRLSGHGDVRIYSVARILEIGGDG